MKSESPSHDSSLAVSRDGLAQAFSLHEAEKRIANTKVGSILVVTLMPAGTVLDWFVYPEHVGSFFQARMICSALAALIWSFLFTEPGRKASKQLGVVVPLLPVVFIAWMIAETEGFASPYYAGLNLVLLAIGFVLQWTVVESVVAVTLVFLIYVAAGLIHGVIPDRQVLVNNFYFVTLMDVIVVVGTYFQSRQRFREFSLRFELDQNQRKLEETNEKLLELGQVKDRFFANISHELRTPLTLLVSPLEILLFQGRFALDDEQKNLLQTMHANAMRLLKMINDLLDLVRLESGRMEVKREPMEVNEFVRSLLNATRQLAQEKQLELTTVAEPGAGSFLADRDKLEKICLNLLFNAIKFTPAGGQIEFRAARDGSDLVLTVKDSGVGISAKQLPFVFDRFWQADNSSKRKFKGVGIGLSLVKELVEIQGGKVSVESEEGKGATFTVRIPYVEADTPLAPAENGAASISTTPSQAAGGHSEEWLANLYRRAELFPVMTHGASAAPSGARASNGDRPTALIADDEPSMVRFISSQIQANYQVVEAIDGREAVEKAVQHVPDVILLDMNMPEKDGLQVCRELRENPSTQKIPVILITARADEETKLAALSAGANDFLSKPFSVAELYVRLKNLVQSHGYQQTLAEKNRTLADTIEQLKATETQLVQSAKMASLGRMSAGIIHEINNPLNFANTGLYSLRGKAKLMPPEQQKDFTEVLQDIEDGLKRVRNIVSDLRTFTHPDTGHVEPVDVSEVVASALRFLSNEWRGKVQIDVDLPKGQTVQANKNRLVQVVLNLVQNSLDALDEKAFPEGEQPAISITGSVTAEKSAILIRDNGQGIDPGHLDKIFDPFFTTKDVGEGMGLGLSICYRIVNEFGGRILVKSEPGKFSEFALEFPAGKENLPA